MHAADIRSDMVAELAEYARREVDDNCRHSRESLSRRLGRLVPEATADEIEAAVDEVLL